MQSTIAAFHITRREIASAIFTGWQLRFWESRSLSSRLENAKTSALAFMNWTYEHFKPELVVVSAVEGATRAAQLHQCVTAILRELGVPIIVIDESTLFAAFGSPPLKNKSQLRQTIHQMFPQLGAKEVVNAVADAAALGIFAQTERFLELSSAVL